MCADSKSTPDVLHLSSESSCTCCTALLTASAACLSNLNMAICGPLPASFADAYSSLSPSIKPSYVYCFIFAFKLRALCTSSKSSFRLMRTSLRPSVIVSVQQQQPLSSILYNLSLSFLTTTLPPFCATAFRCESFRQASKAYSACQRPRPFYAPHMYY